MKKLLLALILFIGYTSAWSQRSVLSLVSGKVITADGKPAAGLLISVKGTPHLTYTRTEGEFRLNMPAGQHTLILNTPFGNQEHLINLTDQSLQLPVIQLRENARELKEVVITGGYKAQSLKNAVQKVRTISNEQLTLRGSVNVLEALSTTLGIRFSNDLTLGETDVQIMGMSGQHVKVLLDGVPVVDRGSTKQSLSQIDINTVDRIEVVEGPMSVIYGTDALAGVINIITKKGAGQESLSINAKIQEETVGREYSGFNNNGVHLQNLAINYLKKGFEIGAAGTRNQNGGWQGANPGRKKQWRPKDQDLVSGRFGYRIDELYVWYKLDYLHENIVSLGDINPLNNRSTDAAYLTNRFTHIAQAEWRLNSRLSLNASASYQNYERETLTTDYDFSTGKETLNLNPGSQDVSGFKSTFARTTLQYAISKNISFQPGFDLKFDEATGQRIHNGASISDYSAFITSEMNWNTSGVIRQLTLKPGLRFTKNSVYEAPPVIPSLNIKISAAKDLVLRLGYARGFRAPALRELYFTFHDASHDIEGNENLKAEYSDSYTASVAWQAIQSGVQLNTIFSGFYNNFSNLISIASSVDPLNPQWNYYVNVDHFKTAGGTIENQLDYKNLQLGIGFSWIGRYNSFTTVDPSLSAFLWSPEINSNLIYRFAKIGLNATIASKFSGKRKGFGYDQNSRVVQTTLGSMHWADLGLAKKINSYLTLNGGIKNIFNVSTISNTAQDAGGAHSTGGAIPMGYGRSFFLGLTMQWNNIN